MAFSIGVNGDPGCVAAERITTRLSHPISAMFPYATHPVD
jgi:hypothetical protein